MDTDILLGFVEEANSYLPTIRQSLLLYASDKSHHEELDMAHRQVHTITGAASMVGLSELGKRARDLEEAIEMYMRDPELPFSEDVVRAFMHQLEGIEQELNTLQPKRVAPISQADSFTFNNWDELTPQQARVVEEAPPAPAPASSSANVDPELAEIFAEEANEYLEAIGQNLAALAGDFNNTEVMRETRRYAHTLKGSAAMMGFPDLSKLSKRIEETFDRLHENEKGVNAQLLELFANAAATLTKLARGESAEALSYDLQVLHQQFDFAIEEATQGGAAAAPAPEPVAPAPIQTFEVSLPSMPQVSPPAAVTSFEIPLAPPAAPLSVPPPADVEALDFNLPPLPQFSETTATKDVFALPEQEAAEVIDEELPTLAEFTAAYQAVAPVSAEPAHIADTDEAVHDLSESSFDADMLEVFRMEAEEHVQNLSQNLEILNRQPDDREALQEIRRSAHTLKGSAALVNVEPVAKLAHRLEDLLDRLYEGTMTVTPEAVAVMFSSTETLDTLSRNIADPNLPEQLADLEHTFNQLLAPSGKPAATTEPVAETPPAEVRSTAATPLETPVSEAVRSDEHDHGFAILETPSPLTDFAESATTDGPVSPLAATTKNQSGRVIRVPLARLDETVKLVSELLISRSMLEQKLTDMERQVQELRLSTARLQRASHRLEIDYEAATLGGGWFGSAPRRGPAANQEGAEAQESPTQHLFRKAGRWEEEFDELELDRYTEFHRLSRELAETSGDTEAISQDCTLLLQDLDGLVLRQRRLINELQERLMHLRMVPLGTLAPRLRRVVQVAAAQLGKNADLSLEGEQIEMDTLVLDALADPLLHLLRNAVAHGIETPEVRHANNKPHTGAIHLTATQEGTEIIIRATDDGGGLNLDAIRAKALANNLVPAADLAKMSDEEVSSLIFLPGFTTSEKVNQVSGRGVGMDIIHAAVMQLKGVITIDSSPGQGTTFTIRVPVALAVTRALVIRDFGETYALPLNAVTRALTLDKAETQERDGRLFLRYDGEAYPVVRLGEVLKLNGSPENRGQDLPVLLLKSGHHSIALSMDILDESRDLVLKSLGTHLGRVPLLLGATIMGDGKVVPIINPIELVQQVATGTLNLRPVIRPRPALKRSLTVMTVDDSPSVRRIMANLIKAQEWTPLPAKDGFDALEILQQAETAPDIILLDMEMPRMDGYELLTALRAQPAWANVPIVMITSRAGDKHRRKAMELGATDYIIKPYQDEVLCATIRRLTQK
jgi:chemosensory pili system protein ChpA (sensor histidine kinase/response regulator)